MKYFIIILIALSITGCGKEPDTSKPKLSEDIFVLIENGGTIASEDQDDALNTSLHLLQQLTSLGRRKATKDIQIHIVLSALPNRIAWSGNAEQLLAQAEDVKNLIVFKPTFSDLVMAFDQIETTVNLTQPDTIRLYWIGSTVHVPFQSGDAAIEVEVPQEVPDELALKNLVRKLKTLKIMRVHPDQDKVLQAYLGSLGILARARTGDLSFELLGNAQTKSRLNTLL